MGIFSTVSFVFSEEGEKKKKKKIQLSSADFGYPAYKRNL